MNKRLLAYLRKLGLDTNATDEQAWEFFRARRGLEASIANCLNHDDADVAARTNCDLMIRALGHNPEDPSQVLIPTTSATASGRQQAGNDGASAAGDLERARAEGQQLEANRRSEIQQLAVMAGSPDEIVRTLIDDPLITVDAARQRLWEDHQARTRASVPNDRPNAAPAVHSRNSVTGNTVEVLAAGMLQRSGIDPTQGWVSSADNGTIVRRRPRGTDLEQLSDQSYQFRAMSIEDFIRAAAAIDGVQLPHGRLGILEAYIRASRSGFSTSALTAIFTVNINSQLLASYEATSDFSTAGFCRDSQVDNFQTQERARMLNGGALDKLPRGSEANHATYEDSVETFKIARYAKQFVMDDQDVQDNKFGNDDFAPSDMGVAAAQLRPDLVASILLGNPLMRDGNALFDNTNHGNLPTSSPLGTAGKLEAVRAGMRKLQENGRNLNLMLKYLIIPAALEDTADVLINSRVLISTDAAKTPSNNPNFGKGLVAVPDARFDNGVTDPTDPTGATVHAGSATTWFGSAVASAHTIEVATLRGTGGLPTIRTKILDQGRWGIGWDVKKDIGAKALNWLGLVKVTG